jgi:3-hydroxymyristoyl/3-hydroxydecanoyl-(acyl carrier protein) dehydratase
MTKNTHPPLLFNREKWYRFSDLRQNDHGEINARIWINPDSPWFSGHFPDNPILPGIAQLTMVFDVICQVKNERFQLEEIKRVRFKRIIRPNDSIEIIVRPDGPMPLTYLFRVESDGELACSGRLSVIRNTMEGMTEQ